MILAFMFFFQTTINESYQHFDIEAKNPSCNYFALSWVFHWKFFYIFYKTRNGSGNESGDIYGLNERIIGWKHLENIISCYKCSNWGFILLNNSYENYIYKFKLIKTFWINMVKD